MYEAMQESTKVNLPIVAHCEDNSLILGGCIHDGKKAKELGLRVSQVFVNQCISLVIFY